MHQEAVFDKHHCEGVVIVISTNEEAAFPSMRNISFNESVSSPKEIRIHQVHFNLKWCVFFRQKDTSLTKEKYSEADGFMRSRVS